MRATLKAEPQMIEEVLTLRRHIAELEGIETSSSFPVRAAVAGKIEKQNSIKQSKDGIFISTRQGSLIDGNQTLLKILGYTIEELFGLNIMDICLNPADGVQFLKAMDGKGYVIDYKMRLRKKDGSEFCCLLTSTIRWYNDDSIPNNQPLFKTWVRPNK